MDDPAADAARLLSRLAIMLLFIVSQAAPVIARQTIYILLPVGAALLLVAASLTPDARKWRDIRALAWSPSALGALFFVAWAGLSLAWTPFSAGAVERFLKNSATLALVATACAFLPARTKTSNLNLLPIGTGAAAAALAAVGAVVAKTPNLAGDLDIEPLQRAGLGLALIVWPALGALALRSRWYSATLLAAATLAACLLTRTPNAAPSLAVGALVLAVSFGGARSAAKILAAFAGAIILFAPLAPAFIHFALAERAPPFAEPLEVWGRIIANDGLRVLTGHGFGAAIFGIFGHYLYQATPRSLIFEVWFDLGVLGAAALAGLAARAFLVVGGVRPVLAPFLLAGLATGLAISVLGPAAEQLWWLSLAGLDAIAFVLVMRGQFRKRRPFIPPNWGTGNREPETPPA